MNNNSVTTSPPTPTIVTSASAPQIGPLKVVRNLSLKRMRGSANLHEKVCQITHTSSFLLLHHAAGQTVDQKPASLLLMLDAASRRTQNNSHFSPLSLIHPIRMPCQVKLDRVLGLTVSSNSAFTSDSQSGCVSYPAG